MKRMNKSESNKVMESFLAKLKKEVSKNETLIEYFELTLQEPHYLKCNCAYIQSRDKKDGILYDAAGSMIFYIKEEVVDRVQKKYLPTLFALEISVLELFPKAIKNAMFGVCGSKTDRALKIEDFGLQFSLTKPNKQDKINE